jgi:hypothetical protein
VKTIAFFNAKGGVGSTMLAACTAILATRDGAHVTCASLDATRDLLRWMIHQGIPWIDATTDLPRPALEYEDLLVLDVHSGALCTDLIRPDLWVVPMDNRTAYENAVRSAPSRHGPELWVWNNVHIDDGEFDDSALRCPRTVPEHLAARVEFAPQIIYRDAASVASADEFRMPLGEGSAHALREFLRDVLIRVDVASMEVHLTGEPSPHGRPWRTNRSGRETPADISAYLHTYARRELDAHERLQAFFAA